MGLVPRSIKQGGTSNYTDSVAQGLLDILDVEIDRDFNDLYTLVNGGLDNANIADNAAIDYSKLNLHGRIQPGDLAGPLPPGSLAPGSVTTTEIRDGTITFLDMALVASVIAGTPTASNQQTVEALQLGNPGQETPIVASFWTTRGGPFFVHASSSAEVVGVNALFPGQVLPAGNATVTCRLRIDGGTGDPLAGGQLQIQTKRAAAYPGQPIPMTFSIPVWGSTILDPVPAGQRRVTCTLQVNSGSQVSTNLVVNHVVTTMVLVELA